MKHLLAVGGLAVMAVIWFVLQRAIGTTETAGRGRCGGCGEAACDKENGEPPA